MDAAVTAAPRARCRSRRAAQRGEVRQQGQAGAAQRPPSRAHRAEAEVDRLLEPPLVGHPRRHRHRASAGRRRRAGRRRPAAPAAAGRGRGTGRTAAPPTRGPRPSGRSARTPGRTARPAPPRAGPRSAAGRRTTVSCPRCAAANALRTANACRLPCGPGRQVSTPSPSRRGSASRRERPLNRPVVWHSESQRMPSWSSRPRTRSAPGPSGSASMTTAGPERGGQLPEGAGQGRRAGPSRPGDHADGGRAAGRGVADVRQQLGDPARGPGQLGDVLGAQRERGPEHVVGDAAPPDDVHPRPPGRGDAGEGPGEVDADEHHRRRAPGAERDRLVVGDHGRDPGGGRQPLELVEEVLVGGHEQRRVHAGTVPRRRAGAHLSGARLCRNPRSRADVDANRAREVPDRRTPPTYHDGMPARGPGRAVGRPTAAFFDLDKTIIARSSSFAFSRPFQAGGLISRRAMLRSAYAQFVYLVGGADHDQMEKMRQFMSQLTRRLGRRDGPRDRRRHAAPRGRPDRLRRGRLADGGAPGRGPRRRHRLHVRGRGRRADRRDARRPTT